MTKPASLKALRAKLNRHQLPFSVQDELFQLGPGGFEFLVEIMSDPASRPLEVTNALQMAFRMRSVGSREAFVKAALHHCEHPDRRVRSVAAKLLAGYTRFAEQYAFERTDSLTPATVVPALERALALGLDGNSEVAIRSLLPGHDSGEP